VPIIERDPWRDQYFTGVDCPDDVVISTDDTDSYRLYPQLRWVYNKPVICETQGIACAPAGIAPERYPVFSKPITNLRGMGIDSHILNNESDYKRLCRPGHFWMEYFTGEHVSIDAALIGGEVCWSRHVTGKASGGGTFDYWHIHAGHSPALEDYCRQWFRQNLRNYTGMVNVETIGGRIIEVHLRFADQWPDLYGSGWVDALVQLYVRKQWSYPDPNRRDAYSVVLFGPHGRNYKHPPEELLAKLRVKPHISSVQITFLPHVAMDWHAMPPGGFRVAIVNCWDLEAGREARADLARFFGI
jgi:hypothetical protein